MPISIRSNIHQLFLVAGICFGLFACGPNGAKPVNPIDTGDQDDTGVQDTTDGDDADGTECQAGETGAGCPVGEVCDEGTCVECVATSDCGVGQICTDQGTCEQGPCPQAGVAEPCDPGKSEHGKGWACIDAGKGPVCMRRCIQEEGDSASCEGNEICLRVGGSPGPDAVCYPTQCNGPTKSSECKGVSQHPAFGEYNDGATCSSVSVEACGSATLCLPAGTQKTGEKCNASSPAKCSSNGPCQACTKGNVCRGGKCRLACTSDSACSGDKECVGDDSKDVLQDGTGFCALACTPYDGTPDCSGSNMQCTGLTTDVGFCEPTGPKGYMEECSPPENVATSNPDARPCKAGLKCQALARTGGVAGSFLSRCLPKCDPPAPGDTESLDNHASCGGTFHGRVTHAQSSPATVDVAANGTQLIDNLAAGSTEAGTSGSADFFTLDVDNLDHGEVTVKVTDGSPSGGSNILMEPTVTVASGRPQTWVLHSDGQLQISALPVPRRIQKPASGSMTAKVRAASLVPDFKASGNGVDVDIVAVPKNGSFSSDKVTLGEEFGASNVGEFKTLEAGTYSLFVFDTTKNISKGNEILKLQDAFSVSARARESVVLTGTFDKQDGVDVGVTAIPYAEAPNAPRFTCFSSGTCFNECEANEYGTSWCNQGASCHPLNGRLTNPDVCLPSGSTNNKPGDTCDPGGFRPCEEGAFCSVDGAGNGTCQSFCVGGNSGNSSLSCGNNLTCTGEEGALGRCRQTCKPGNNLKDSNCPSNLQSCIPQPAGSGGTTEAFCSASGSKSKGETCGGSGQPLTSLRQNCAPGTVCAHKKGGAQSTTLALQGMFFHKGPIPPGVCSEAVANPSAPSASCRQTCDPFASDPDCPNGQACGIAFNYQTPLVGVCLQQAEDVSSPASGTNCGADNVGKLCGDRSYCLPLQGGLVNNCVQWCNPDTGKGCAGDRTCEESAIGAGIGICTPILGDSN